MKIFIVINDCCGSCGRVCGVYRNQVDADNHADADRGKGPCGCWNDHEIVEHEI